MVQCTKSYIRTLVDTASLWAKVSKMSLWVQAILLTLFIASPPWRIGFVNGKIDPNDKGEPLFKEGHPNITYLTDGNFDDMMSKYSDRPWLVDFYHPLYVFLYIQTFVDLLLSLVALIVNILCLRMKN